MFRDQTRPTLFRTGTVPETVPVRSLSLSEIVMTVSLSTVLLFVSGEADARGRVGGVANSTHHAFMRDQMMQHLDDYRCSAE